MTRSDRISLRNKRLAAAGWRGAAAAVAWAAVAVTMAAEPESDFVFDITSRGQSGASLIQAATPKTCTVLAHGLSRGGAVEVECSRGKVLNVQLIATGGLAQGHADRALVALDVPAGETRVRVVETDGVQIVRAAEGNIWFAACSTAKGEPLFSVDLDKMPSNDAEYPIAVHFDGRLDGRDRREPIPAEPFCQFSGKFDRYPGDSYAGRIDDVSGDSGRERATLRYTAVQAPMHLCNPTSITVEPDSRGGFSLRVRQELRATGSSDTSPSWGDNVEFLHLVINSQYGRDWEDGMPDFVWYRAQRDDAPDTLPGSHTTLARMDDDSRRSYPFPTHSADPYRRGMSGGHHTGAAVSMEAVNTIGGWFTKSGTGCVGLVFHDYRSSFRDDLAPLHSHCGDGADTHVYLFWGDLFRPLGMKGGDTFLADYSLSILPSEPIFTEIEDINEADLWIFGKASDQKSRITGWLGSKEAIGLTRSDGSVILLGIGGRAGRFPVPEAARAARRSFHVTDLGRPKWEQASIIDGHVEVRPRRITVLDAGSALIGPPGDNAKD